MQIITAQFNKALRYVIQSLPEHRVHETGCLFVELLIPHAARIGVQAFQRAS